MNEKKLPAFIEEIIAGLDVVEIEEVTIQLSNDERPVGIMPEELQRLASLWRKWRADFEVAKQAAAAQLEAIDSRAEQNQARERLNRELGIAKNKSEQIAELFWLSLRIAFPELARKTVIGYAEGYQAYWKEPGPHEEVCDCPICSAMHNLSGARVIGPIHLPGLSAILDSIFRGIPDEQEREGEEPPPESEEPNHEGEKQKPE